jgi:peptide-methionine (R)-S-oxide reductase
VTPIVPRFYLGEEYRFEDHDSSLFCALKRSPHRETFQLARALRKKGGSTIFFSRRESALLKGISALRIRVWREAFKYPMSDHIVMVVTKTDEDWKRELDPQQYKVLRKKATEPAFTGKYLHNKEKGIYICAACGTELFSSDTKYDSGSGWPSFWTALAKDSIVEVPDRTLGTERIEILCKNCGSHLGHVFDDGPQPTGVRYCVNSLSLDFKKKDTK